MKKTLLTLSLIFIAFYMKAGTITVQNTNDAGAGTLRQAVIDAVDGDTIRFNPNLIAGGNNTIRLASEIAFNKGLVFKGLYNAIDTLFISGENSVRIFNINLDSASNKVLVIDSLVLINGNAGGSDGGAIRILEVDSLVVLNSILTNNSAYRGGGVRISSSFISINNSTLTNNSASTYGGGVYSSSPSSSSSFISINNSTLTNNSASNNSGGGVYSYSYSYSSISINNSTLTNNSAYNDDGGGVYSGCYSNYSSYSSVSINNSTLTNNSAYNGGGVYSLADSSSVNINNSTLTNNSASEGGGVYSLSNANSSSSSISINNSTLANNGASNNGGGVYSACFSYPSSSSSISINNSTLTNNGASNNGGGVYSFASYSSSSFISINNSTLTNNGASNNGGGVYSESSSSYSFSIINTKGSIIAFNGSSNIYNNNLQTINSMGYNIFSDATLTGSTGSDYLGATTSQVNLGSLANNGGTTLTMLPGTNSIAVDAGDPTDNSNAQNGSVVGIRDIGAAESRITVGLNEFSKEITANLYPNPTFNQVFIELDDIKNNYNLVIMDLSGKEVMSKLLTDKLTKLNVSQYKSGVYVVRIFNTQKQGVFRLVLE